MTSRSIASGTLSSRGDLSRTEEHHRGRDSGRRRRGREPRRRPFQCTRGQRSIRRAEPRRTAPAGHGAVRRSARRGDPRAVPQDGDTMSEQTNPIREAIAQAISENNVILFMKGTPDAPARGFSARTAAALQALDTPFAAVDILPDPRIRQELSALSNWPTIPQLFVGGELVGGADIIAEMYATGELAEVLGVDAPDDAPEEAP